MYNELFCKFRHKAGWRLAPALYTPSSSSASSSSHLILNSLFLFSSFFFAACLCVLHPEQYSLVFFVKVIRSRFYIQIKMPANVVNSVFCATTKNVSNLLVSIFFFCVKCLLSKTQYIKINYKKKKPSAANDETCFILPKSHCYFI